jgi:hypothetical protein
METVSPSLTAPSYARDFPVELQRSLQQIIIVNVAISMSTGWTGKIQKCRFYLVTYRERITILTGLSIDFHK